jgi:uncharacterized protein (DUF433 family)
MSTGRTNLRVARAQTAPATEGALIVVDPTVCAGKPVVRGTRVPVEYLIRMARTGYAPQTIAAEFDLPPRLVKEILQLVERSTALKFA